MAAYAPYRKNFMTSEELMNVVQTYRYRDAMFVIVDSLPTPFQESFAKFLSGSAVPVCDGLNRYAFTSDFERWLEDCPLVLKALP